MHFPWFEYFKCDHFQAMLLLTTDKVQTSRGNEKCGKSYNQSDCVFFSCVLSEKKDNAIELSQGTGDYFVSLVMLGFRYWKRIAKFILETENRLRRETHHSDGKLVCYESGEWRFSYLNLLVLFSRPANRWESWTGNSSETEYPSLTPTRRENRNEYSGCPKINHNFKTWQDILQVPLG